MELKKWLKGRGAETILCMVQSKVNAYKEGRKLDKILDEQLGERSSEKIQRGTVTIMLMQFLLGLFAESPEALATIYEQQALTIRKGLKKGGKKC